MRPTKLLTTAGLAAILGVAAIAPDAGAQGIEMNVYTGLTREQAEPVLASFAKSAGKAIKFNVLSSPTEELMAQLNLELTSGQTKADVLWMDKPQLQALDKMHRNAFEKVDSAHYAALLPSVKTGNYMEVVPTGLLMYVLMYNKASLPNDTHPKSFAELLDPKWQNKLTLANPQSSAGVHNFFWMITQHLGKQQPYGWDYFKKLHALNPTYPSGHGNIRDLVIKGERPVGVQFIFNITGAIERGEQVWWAWPTEGVPTGEFSVSVMKASKQRDTGKQLVDWLISPAGQADIAKFVALTPVNSTVDFSFKDGKKPSDLKLVPVDGAYITENRMEIIEGFQKATGG